MTHVWLLDWIDYDNRGGQAEAFATAEGAMTEAATRYTGRWTYSEDSYWTLGRFDAVDAPGVSDPCPTVWRVEVGP